jgi:hypothetical protein
MAWLHKFSNSQRKIKTMADATNNKLREQEIMIRLIDIKIFFGKKELVEGGELGFPEPEPLPGLLLPGRQCISIDDLDDEALLKH